MSSKLSKWIAFPIVVIGTVLIASFYYHKYTNPLPNDEELIAHFQAHRGEFEELVKRYRQYEPEQVGMHHLWKDQGDTPQLLKRAGVRRFSGTGGLWIPDPYSADYKSRRQALFDQHDMEWMSTKYGHIRVYLENSHYDTTSLSKTLLNFPEAPRVTQGVLIIPGGDEKKQIANQFTDERVLSSLDDNIPKKGYCALRQIDAQWFISVCHF